MRTADRIVDPVSIYCLPIMKPYLDLTGRVALVTGASSGIGAATAVTLADLGAKVALSYHRNRQGAEETRDRIVAAGGTAIALAADVRRAEDIRALVHRASAELGPIDILVNNAGSLVARFGIPRSPRNASTKSWRSTSRAPSSPRRRSPPR